MKQIFLLFIFILIVATTNAQDKFSVSGYITDASGESLVGANVIVNQLKKGAVTNNYGFFSLTLPKGDYKVQVSYIGYKVQDIPILLDKNQKLNIKLEESAEMMESVEVTAEKRDANIREVTMSTEKLDIKTIKRIPTLGGETDVIKVIQLQPGVQTVGDGNSGFFVRGGAVDQNLILLDEAVVYNPAHMGGFFSVFNGDAVKDVTLYKGGIPSRFGGRLSSILDVRMKDGSMNKVSGSGGVGLISSRLTLEAPLVNDKCSFILSGRRTYYDLFMPYLNDPMVKKSKSYFYDFNGKINYIVNDNNRVYLSAYSGQDVMKFGDVFEMSYGNITGTARWNHIFSDKMFANYTLIYSNFNYELGQPDGSFAFSWTSNIIDYSLKNDYTFYLNPNNTLTYGVQVMYHTIKPGKFDPGSESNFKSSELPHSFSLESAAFIGNEQKISSAITLQYGLRFSMFNNVGGTLYKFDNSFNPIDSVIQKKGKIYHTYTGLEPRFSLMVKTGNKSSVKASYNRMFQYLHLATNTAATTPLDVWFSSNQNIKPQYADQVALGFFRNFDNNMFEASAEVYYKKMHNAIDFKDHAQLFGNTYFDGELRRGDAYSYGLELYVRKQQGKLTGWISYTYSKTRKKINGLNNNEEYPSPYDRPNDLKVVVSYDFTPRLNVSANWVYYTALPMTVANQWFSYEGMWVPEYSARNSYRVPENDYHRLDLAVNWENKPVFHDKFHSTWTLSVFNVYNRHNLNSLVYQENPNGGPPEIYKMYLFKTIPTITYNFKF